VGTISSLKKTAVAEKLKERGERIKKIVFVYVKKNIIRTGAKRKFFNLDCKLRCSVAVAAHEKKFWAVLSA